MLSSATVTSTAVPKVATVLRNDSPSMRSGTAIACSERRCLAAGVALGLVEQLREPRVGGHHQLAPEPGEQVRAPLGEVLDPGREPVGVQADPQDVGEQRLGTPSISGAIASLAATRSHQRSITSAGNGSWARSTASIASRTGAISGESIVRSP